jgi:hypothetical protein
MFLGTVDDWSAEGAVVSWYPTKASHASAAVAEPHAAPLSYQQSQHLQYYRRQTSLGRDIPRLCLRSTKLSAESISKRTARSRNRAKQEGVVRDDGG